MQEAARWAAAIEVFDQILAGQAGEAALLNWARAHRFAGSKDRAAIRDLVFDALRNKRSAQALAGADTGRATLIGLALDQGRDLAEIFNGSGHAPAPLSEAETSAIASTISEADRHNIPDWLESRVSDDERALFGALTARAPIDLRANPRRATLAQIRQTLRAAGHEPAPIEGLPNGLRLPAGVRGLRNLRAFEQGWFEFQDAGAQRLVADLNLDGVETVLDYCAGGGGKSLALASMNPDLTIAAYDVDQGRLDALKPRAKRAGAAIKCLKADPATTPSQFDLVILDVPCSGSGAWRRNPDGKWTLSAGRWDELVSIQRDILAKTVDLVAPNGRLVYMTCSIFERENQAQQAWFLEQFPDYHLQNSRLFPVCDAHDGFFSFEVTKRTDS